MQQECNKVPQDASLDARCIERVTSIREVHTSRPGGVEKLKDRTDLKDAVALQPRPTWRTTSLSDGPTDGSQCGKGIRASDHVW